ncbi:hypothetical protein [Nostoc sp.]|uniref:hypothetical protein n=1 Tax=Nostoc sp. TaxID=1180 RepID=UPI002FFCED2F
MKIIEPPSLREALPTRSVSKSYRLLYERLCQRQRAASRREERQEEKQKSS